MRILLKIAGLAFGVAILSPMLPATPFPKGLYVLYSRVGNPEGTIGVVNLDTGLDVSLMKGAWPALAPNAPLLLYHTGNPNFAHANINLRNVISGADTQLLSGTDYIVGVDWSLDNQSVIFDYSCDIELIKINGTGRRGFISGDCYDDAPSVNPVDGRIVFHNANAGLFLADEDGQHRRFFPNTQRGDVWPVWSSAEDQVAFWAGTSLIVQNVDGSNRTDLSAKAKVTTTLGDGRPAFTPDGEWVVAATTVNGENGLWAFAVDGKSAVVRLPTAPGEIISWVGGVLLGPQVTDWFSVSLSSQVNPPSVLNNAPAGVTISLMNRGPGVLRGLRLTNQVPSDVTVVGSEISTGTLAQIGGAMVAQVAELRPGAILTETFQLSSAVSGGHSIVLTAIGTNTGVASVVATGNARFFVGPPQPLYNEGVIYGRQNADGYGVWYAPADGGNEVKITDGGRPRLSPDGTGLAFTRGNVAGSLANLWWRDLGTGEEKQIFTSGDYLVGLTWSADSAWVIFDYSCGIYARTRNGADPGLAIGGSCYYDSPSIQPTDGRIAFHSSDGLYTGNASYQNIQKIPDTHAGDYWPAWSPDGNWILFVDAGDLWIIHPGGSGRTRLTQNAIAGEGFVNPAVWTSTGRFVVAAGKVAGQAGIFKIVPSGHDSPVLYRSIPNDSQVTDVGAAVGNLLEGIKLHADLGLTPGGVPKQAMISGPVVPFVLEATTNFVNWVRVSTNTPAIRGSFVEDLNTFRFRFYRGVTLP